MSNPQSDKIHPIWGRSIQEYTRSYSWASLAANCQVPVDETNRATRREVALHTIEQISMIDYSGIDNPLSSEIVNRVTLEKLECVLELTRFPGELDNFVVPSLVAGCITLMSSIKPSPLSYEYGYLCFRVLVIALNTCLLKHGRNPNEALRIPNIFGPNYLADLWSETAALLRAELGGISEIFFEMPDMRPGPRAAPHLEAMRLDILLTLLHSDQKNFTILLKEANSLGLSGLIYVLLKFVEKNKADMNEERLQEFSTVID
ncbi:unnamed protein product [Rhizoctonia solani]|uniref:Uncharacterized protein n=1 Tax=Rhizoctonia solani TaxID=456999 RepID=A0A8H3BKL2_9AGAM|nr:unnamed protein product [Rhizoctonia solani]